NLVRLANALYPLIGEKDPLEQGLGVYAETYEREAGRMMAAKIGLAALEREGDDRLLGELFELLGQVETDVTLFFRLLAAVPLAGEANDAALGEPVRRGGSCREAR